jgi:uncharacterized protein (DUF58 family)
MTYLILILLVIAFVLNVDFIFYVIYVCLGLYLWTRFATPRALSKLVIERHFHDHAFWGEKIPITLRLKNENRLALPWLQFSEAIATELRGADATDYVLSLRGGETAEFTYTLHSRRRGYYKVGPLRVQTGDLFGLQTERHGQVPASYFTVYPRLIPLTQLGLPSRLPFGTIASQQRLFEDPARPMGVRNYVSGDSLRQINWKVSAHTRNLMVKTFQPAISLETAVLLNLHSDDSTSRGRNDFVEWGIIAAASLAAHLIDQRQAVGFHSNGLDPLHGADESNFDEESGRLRRHQLTSGHTAIAPAIAARNGRPHLMKILERLARLESENTIPFVDWVQPACAHLSWGVTILAITPSSDEATCHALHRLVRSGFNPVLIAIEPHHNFGEVRERARRLGFAAYNVAGERDLDHWRRLPKT